MSADTITTIANAAYAETLTQVQLPELRSMDLRASTTSTALTSRTHVEYECYRSSETIGADAIEIVYFPETGRAAVASGAHAEYTATRFATARSTCRCAVAISATASKQSPLPSYPTTCGPTCRRG